MSYNVLPTANNPALIIYLIDVSGSMATRIQKHSRIEVVTDALQIAFKAMLQRSTKDDRISPRYRIAIYAYSDDVYDVLDGVKTIEQIAQMGVPSFQPLSHTDSAKAFLEVEKLLKRELPKLDNCPAPLVCHITDGEYTGLDPEPIVRRIQSMKTSDGNVLVENIFISENILLSPIDDLFTWTGISNSTPLSSKYADKLRNMSSQIPESYRENMLLNGYSIQEDALMMIPGQMAGFIKLGFLMTTFTMSERFTENDQQTEKESNDFEAQSQDVDIDDLFNVEMPDWITREPEAGETPQSDDSSGYSSDDVLSPVELPSWVQAMRPVDSSISDSSASSALDEESVAIDGDVKDSTIVTEDEKEEIDLKRILDVISEKFFTLKIAHPKLISKRFESIFLIQLYFEELEMKAKLKVNQAIGMSSGEHNYDTELKLGQVIRIKLFSPDIAFPEAITKKLGSSINSTTFLGKPLDSCYPGKHDVVLSILDNETNIEMQSETFSVTVVDFAFDHVSRPLLSRVSAIVLGIGSFAMFTLALLEQIDKTIGLTSGTAAGVLAVGIYASFYNLYQRVRPNIP